MAEEKAAEDKRIEQADQAIVAKEKAAENLRIALVNQAIRMEKEQAAEELRITQEEEAKRMELPARDREWLYKSREQSQPLKGACKHSDFIELKEERNDVKFYGSPGQFLYDQKCIWCILNTEKEGSQEPTPNLNEVNKAVRFCSVAKSHTSNNGKGSNEPCFHFVCESCYADILLSQNDNNTRPKRDRQKKRKFV
uniref:Uncharacterized protein n=1 Tax=Attheya septentrionalis TaxID=420275 RepID=A0A7S2U6Y1_9STRA